MFESARLKVDRAEHHIDQLRRTVDRYSDTAGIEFEPDGKFATITIDRRAEPACSVIIGDVVHNLRAALDHAFWELVGIDGGKQNRYTAFPIHWGAQTDYEAACKGIETPRDDTKKLMISIGLTLVASVRFFATFIRSTSSTSIPC